MEHQRPLGILTLLITLFAATATLMGILSAGGPGPSTHHSLRGADVPLYGVGLYQDMSADVAIQGIAQDYVTLGLALPLLLVTFWLSRRGSLRARFVFAGIVAYLFVTYLFYLVMAMYNALFLVYVALAGLSFFALLLTVLSFPLSALPQRFSSSTPTKGAGIFLIVTVVLVAFLWLSVVVRPLLDGSVIPRAAEHYTTLVVQGLDLALLHPLAVVAGLLLIRKRPLGYLGGTIYVVFLVFLMTALVAKLIFMALQGVSVVPAIVLIPALGLTALAFAFGLLRGLEPRSQRG